MGDWTINVVRVPIDLGPFGTYYHNAIIIRDGNGNFYREIDGGPINPITGELYSLSSPLLEAISAYTSGSYPVGVQAFDYPAFTGNAGVGIQVYSGSEQPCKGALRFNRANKSHHITSILWLPPNCSAWGSIRKLQGYRIRRRRVPILLFFPSRKSIKPSSSRI